MPLAVGGHKNNLAGTGGMLAGPGGEREQTGTSALSRVPSAWPLVTPGTGGAGKKKKKKIEQWGGATR